LKEMSWHGVRQQNIKTKTTVPSTASAVFVLALLTDRLDLNTHTKKRASISSFLR